jgi:hypothetical protein
MCFQLETSLKDISSFISQYSHPLTFLGGALFAKLLSVLDKITERKDKNYNTLVKLQGYFNDCHNIASNNLFILDKIEGIVGDAKNALETNNIIRINSFSEFERFITKSELLSGLTDLDFINEINSVNSHLEIANADISSYNRLFEKIKEEMELVTNQIITGRVSKVHIESLKMNLNGAHEMLITFKQFFEYIKDKSITLKSATQVLSKKGQTILSRIVMFFAASNSFKKVTVEIEQNKIKTKKDLEEEFMRNRERNAEIFNNTTEQ